MEGKRSLSIGQMIVGPDAYGCINSGMAPAICHSRIAKKHLEKPWVVGRHFEIKFNNIENILKSMRNEPTPYVKFFKKSKPAWKEFDRLCKQMLESNRQDVEHVRKLRTQAKNGDMDAVLSLNDY